MKKLILFCASFMFVLATAATSAHALTAGTYNLLIQPTPTKVIGTGTNTTIKTTWGKDPSAGGHWRSSFNFGQTPGSGSQIMPDNTGDGWAGVINVTLDTAGNLTTNSFQKDMIPGTAGGNFTQGGTVTGTGGSISGGTIVWDPTGRLGAVSGFPLSNKPWNIDSFGGLDSLGCKIDNGNTTYGTVNTTSATAFIPGATTIHGSPIWTDANGDVWAVLVTGGAVGSDWGGFFGAAFYEIWKVKIVAAAVPEPGSLLLIGTGLVGLVGLARKRRNK